MPKRVQTSVELNGYYTVSINGNNEYVHRLVAKAFIDNPNNLNEINHKDEDKSNNRVDNLEWCTKSYNVSASAIYNCLYGKSKTCKGYEWIKR